MNASARSKIRTAVAARQAAIGDFTRQLVAIPTENPPGARYRECVDLISGELTRLGIAHDVMEVPGAPPDAPRYCVLGSLGSGDRALCFHGHYDVVPAMTASQFEPHVEHGTLFGRGASDMKSGLALMIHAARALEDAAVSLDGRIDLVIVPDEETGGQFGSQHLAATGRLGAGAVGMLLPEPTSGVVWNANRGAISLRVTVNGKAAHVGLQHLGRNAFDDMRRVADALATLKSEVERQATGFVIEPAVARQSILMLGGRVEGGTNFNLVPGACSFTIDRRLNPEEDLATERRKLFAVLDRMREEGVELDVEVIQEGRSAGVSEETAIARALASNIETVTGAPARFEMCPGLLEIRFYAERGVPALAYGPGLLSVSHGPNEFVRLDDVYRAAAVYALTAAEVLAGDC